MIGIMRQYPILALPEFPSVLRKYEMKLAERGSNQNSISVRAQVLAEFHASLLEKCPDMYAEHLNECGLALLEELYGDARTNCLRSSELHLRAARICTNAYYRSMSMFMAGHSHAILATHGIDVSENLCLAKALWSEARSIGGPEHPAYELCRELEQTIGYLVAAVAEWGIHQQPEHLT
jgi:hypothetical protein